MSLSLSTNFAPRCRKSLALEASLDSSTSSARFQTTTRRRSSQSFVRDRFGLRVGCVRSSTVYTTWLKIFCCLDCGGRGHVQASSMSAHRHDREHLCVRVPMMEASLIANTLHRYCPGGPDSDFDYSTQSYTGYEPTSMRAIRARYDPYEQTRGRVEQLKALGHSVDKVRVVILLDRGCPFKLGYSGRIHHNGRHIYEHARGLSHKVYRAVTQCPVGIYWPGRR